MGIGQGDFGAIMGYGFLGFGFFIFFGGIFVEKFGYKKLTKDDKAKIFGLNAAKVYGIDLKEKLKQFPKDTLTKLKTAYLDDGGQRENAAHGWVRAEA